MKRQQITALGIVDAAPKMTGVRVGRVVEINRRCVAVDFKGNPFGPAMARLTQSVTLAAVRKALAGELPVLLTFENNDPAYPILFDVVEPTIVKTSKRPPATNAAIDVLYDSPSPRTIENPTWSYGPSAKLCKIVRLRDNCIEVQIHGANGEPILAATVSPLRNLIDDVLVVFPENSTPVILGQLFNGPVLEPDAASDVDVVLRGHRIRIEAEAEISLKAGACELQLDARGKATTTADHVVSRARGVNKIQGGSVQLN